jgi:hypothetical protein
MPPLDLNAPQSQQGTDVGQSTYRRVLPDSCPECSGGARRLVVGLLPEEMTAEIQQPAGGGGLLRVASMPAGDREEGPLDAGVALMRPAHALGGEHRAIPEPFAAAFGDRTAPLLVSALRDGGSEPGVAPYVAWGREPSDIPDLHCQAQASHGADVRDGAQALGGRRARRRVLRGSASAERSGLSQRSPRWVAPGLADPDPICPRWSLCRSATSPINSARWSSPRRAGTRLNHSHFSGQVARSVTAMEPSLPAARAAA